MKGLRTAEGSSGAFRGALWVWILSPLPVLGAFWSLKDLGPWPAERGIFQIALACAGLAWLVGVWASFRLPAALRQGRQAWGSFLYVGVIGALLRGLVLVATPALSDDVNRYVFEGGLVAQGTSPYAHAPADPERAAEREAWAELYAAVNHPEVSAAYPPLIQYVFGLGVSLAGGPAKTIGAAETQGAAPEFAASRVFRVFFSVCDLGLGLLLGLALMRRGRAPAVACIWVYCPLVVMEFAGSAHFDVLGVLLFMAAVLLFEGRDRSLLREGAAFVTLGLGVAIKFLPVLALPFLFAQGRRPWRGLSLFAATFLLSFVGLFFLDGGASGLTRGLDQYALRWESFSMLFRVLEAPFEAFLPQDGSWLDARRFARGAIALIFLVHAFLLLREGASPERGARSLVALFLVLTPTLHPWYLTWLLPFLVLKPSLAWFLFLAAAPLLYWPLTEWRALAEWREPGWLWLCIVPPFLMLWILETRIRENRSSNPPA